MAAKKVHQVTDGEWVDVGSFATEVCCDCNLVHRVMTRMHNGRLQVAWWRDDDMTEKLRNKSQPRPSRRPRKRARAKTNDR
jgi:hypothetical protein